MSTEPILTPAETIAKLSALVSKMRQEHRAELAPFREFARTIRSALGLPDNADRGMLVSAIEALVNGSPDDPRAAELRESAIAAKVTSATAALTKERDDANARATALEAEATAAAIDRALDRAAASSAVMLASVPDMKLRAAGLFVLDDKQVVRTKPGLTDGTPPNLTAREWVETILRQNHPHYFIGSEGGGARSGSPGKKVPDRFGRWGGLNNPYNLANRGNLTNRALAVQELGTDLCRELAAMANTALSAWEGGR